VFLDKLKAQGWFELFTNTQLGCSQPDVAEFYANVSVSEGMLISTVNGVIIEDDARALRVILGVLMDNRADNRTASHQNARQEIECRER